MAHYLISNAKIIEELSQLYKGKLDIDKIKEYSLEILGS